MFTTPQIDSIIKHIDSTCISGGIKDYTFYKKGNKRKQIGSGADWYYTDSSGVNLLKVIAENSLNSEIIDRYYFYKDSLIFFQRTNGIYDSGKMIINWSQKCYFTKEAIFLQQDSQNVIFNPKTILETAKRFFNGTQLWRRTSR